MTARRARPRRRVALSRRRRRWRWRATSLQAPPSPDPVALVSLLARPPARRRRRGHDPEPVIADRVHCGAPGRACSTVPARFLAVRFPGSTRSATTFCATRIPTPFGDVSEDERRRYGRVLERVLRLHRHASSGGSLETLGPDDLLLVVSAFGMEPLSPGKRMLERLVGNPAISGTHERAPDGFLLAYGRPCNRPPTARVGAGPDADHPVLPGSARGPRHGRLRAHRSVPPSVHRRAADDLHSDVWTLIECGVPSAECRVRCRVPGAECRVLVQGAGCRVRSAGCGVPPSDPFDREELQRGRAKRQLRR